MKDLAIVLPVRVNSSRIKEKAFQPFWKSDLISWKLNQLSQIDGIKPEQIIVSTNSEQIKAQAEKKGFTIHHREDFFCEDHKASFSELVEYIATWVKKNTEYKDIAWTYCVTPFMGPAEYKKSFERYYQNQKWTEYDSLATVNILKEFFWDHTWNAMYNANQNHPYSQDLHPLYRITNALYMAPVDLMIKKKYFLGDEVYLDDVSKIAGIDIDTPEDLQIARALINTYIENHINQTEIY